jgi:hypothetical protein
VSRKRALTGVIAAGATVAALLIARPGHLEHDL